MMPLCARLISRPATARALLQGARRAVQTAPPAATGKKFLRNVFLTVAIGVPVTTVAGIAALAASDYLYTPPPITQQEGRAYHWISPEAEELIAKAYKRHQALADSGSSFPPALNLKDLESLDTVVHYPAKTFDDQVAEKMVKYLEMFMHLFFRTKYDHHAVTLETVAAVPGIVGAMFRHLRSLRRMERDHGWINPLLEEAENERMHLLIWMQVTQPTFLERCVVIAAQGAYLTAYVGLYAISARTAHRMVGYLEESAHRAYTEYLHAIDNGAIPNRPAPLIAKTYYRLPEDSTVRDVVLCVRGDECMHRDFNHMLSDTITLNGKDSPPIFMTNTERSDKLGTMPSQSALLPNNNSNATSPTESKQ